MRPLALTLVLVLAALGAGCLAGAGDPISMKDGLADAKAAARDWGDDPQLVGAIAIEPFERIEDRADDGTLRGEFVTHMDGNPGDGRAPGWLYAFVSADGRCIFIALASGLGVLAEGWEDCPADAGDAADESVVPSDILDSDDVADILDDLAGWPDADESTTLTWALWVEEGAAQWEVSAGNTTSYVEASVDAVTGEARLVSVEQDDGTGGWAGEPDAGASSSTTYETASATGSAPAVTVATPLELTIDVGEGASMMVTAATGSSLTNQARVTVADGQGQTYLDEQFLGSFGSMVEELPAGTYTVTIAHPTLVLMVSMTVEASWIE